MKYKLKSEQLIVSDFIFLYFHSVKHRILAVDITQIIQNNCNYCCISKFYSSVYFSFTVPQMHNSNGQPGHFPSSATWVELRLCAST